MKDELVGEQVPCPKCAQLVVISTAEPSVGRLHEFALILRTRLLNGSLKLRRREFDTVVAPILTEAEKIGIDVGESKSLPAGSSFTAALDTLSESVLRALEHSLDTTDEDPDRERMYADSQRAFFYACILKRRLLGLPLSAAKRKDVSQSLRQTIELLYRDFDPPADFDPTRCFFFPNEAADPDAALEVPIFRTLKATRNSFEYEPRRILIPRSVRAAKLHAELKGIFDWPFANELTQDLRNLIERLDGGTEALNSNLARREPVKEGRRGFAFWWMLELPAFLFGAYVVNTIGQELKVISILVPIAVALAGGFFALLCVRFLFRAKYYYNPNLITAGLKEFLRPYYQAVSRRDSFPPYAIAIEKNYEYGFAPSMTLGGQFLGDGEEQLRNSRVASRISEVLTAKVQVEEKARQKSD